MTKYVSVSKLHFFQIWWILVQNLSKLELTSLFSMIYLALNCYPQYRLIKKFRFYKDEARLHKELEEHDLRISSLEAIFEAIFQVRFLMQ